MVLLHTTFYCFARVVIVPSVMMELFCCGGRIVLLDWQDWERNAPVIDYLLDAAVTANGHEADAVLYAVQAARQ